jgi:CPA1 family monovalent cation:H+ antiporter
MAALELVVLIGAAVLGGELLARRFRLPSPLILVVVGAGLSFLPGLRTVQFPPDIVLLIFLPALVYWESLDSTSLREIRLNLRAIVLAAVGLVLATALCVGAVGSALGLTWPLALTLATLPRHTSAILRTESLVNDGTSLALYGVAVGAVVTGGHVSLPLFGAEFVWSAVASVAIGLAVGGLVLWIRRYVTEEHLASTLSLLTPFLAFLPAEEAHASGVVAVVVCGIVIAQGGPRVIPAAARRQVFGFWQVASFVLNDVLFVLTGLQLHQIVTGLDAGSRPLVLALAAAVTAVVIGLRLLWFHTVPYVLRALDRRPVQRTRRVSARHRTPLAWAGMRGSISLAAALALPLSTDSGLPLPHREALIAVTFAVIVLTVAVQGLTLPAVLRWSRLPADPTQDYEEALALRTAYQTAVKALPAIAADLGAPDEVRDRLVMQYRAQVDELKATMDDNSKSVVSTEATMTDWERQLGRAVLPAKRDAVLGLRHTGRIDDVVLRRVQARFDAQELRLSDVVDEDT